jgi:hypothetical protein
LTSEGTILALDRPAESLLPFEDRRKAEHIAGRLSEEAIGFLLISGIHLFDCRAFGFIPVPRHA